MIALSYTTEELAKIVMGCLEKEIRGLARAITEASPDSPAEDKLDLLARITGQNLTHDVAEAAKRGLVPDDHHGLAPVIQDVCEKLWSWKMEWSQDA